jgi:hypothetical protein
MAFHNKPTLAQRYLEAAGDQFKFQQDIGRVASGGYGEPRRLEFFLDFTEIVKRARSWEVEQEKKVLRLK